MNQENLIVKRALKEMKILILENQNLKKEVQNLENLLNKTNNIDSYIIPSTKNPHNIERHLREADEAMDRYNKKLRKETAKYAKQKQSKG